MRTLSRLPLTLILCAASLFVAACARGGGSPSASAPSDGVRRVTVSELSEALEKGEAVAVDVRGGVDFDLGHIRGALSVPLGLVAARAKELPRDKLIVAYCA